MIIINDRIAYLPSSSRIVDLIEFAGHPGPFEKMQICVPNSIGFNETYEEEDIGLISEDTCYGCLCCLENNDALSLNKNGTPCTDKSQINFSELSRSLFQGRFMKVGPNPTKFWKHSEANEKNHTTPIAANLLLFLSKQRKDVALRCSPNWELSIDTMDPDDHREGHLDLVLVSYTERKILVAEVKSSVNSLLRDKNRDQWFRYKEQIYNEVTQKNFEFIFIYIIGGDEYSLCPPNDSNCPTMSNNRRSEFYEFIHDNNKKFISLEALRAIKLQKLSTHREWYWEKWLYEIFSSEKNIGLISGGIINNSFTLQPCGW